MKNYNSLFVQERAASVERTTVKVIRKNLISNEVSEKSCEPPLLKIAKKSVTS